MVSPRGAPFTLSRSGNGSSSSRGRVGGRGGGHPVVGGRSEIRKKATTDGDYMGRRA